MGFKQFQKSTISGGKLSVHFSAHMMSVSGAADRALGRPERIDYLYDADAGVPAIRAGTTYPAHRRRAGGFLTGCRSFAKTYQLAGKKFEGVMEDGILVLRNGLSK